MHCGMLIEELDEKQYGEHVKLCGWIEIKPNCTVNLIDFSGQIEIDVECNSIGYRDVVSVEGEYVRPGKIKISKLNVINKNTMINESMLSNRHDDYLKRSFLYNLKKERIDLLKSINEAERVAREFLTYNNSFIEMKAPVFWTTIKEYGDNEWTASFDNTDSNEKYYLPQSPEVISLLNAIGGVQRNFMFGRCFRNEEENKGNDSVVEFTQLVITASFYDLSMGKNLVEELFRKIIEECDNVSARDIVFNRISYDDSLRYYNTDKPDLRYKDTFITKYDNIELLITPVSLKDSIIDKMDKLLANETCDDCVKLNYYKNNEEIDSRINIEELREKYDLSGEVLIFALNTKCDNYGDIIEKVRIITHNIYVYKGHYIPKYCFTWLDELPFSGKNLKDLEHNIFSKIKNNSFDIVANGGKAYTQCLDLVLNGMELASGGIREKSSKNFMNLLEFHEIEDVLDDYGYYIDALNSGAPELFTISLGWERVLMGITESKCIHEVINFPKDSNGRCRITNAPK